MARWWHQLGITGVVMVAAGCSAGRAPESAQQVADRVEPGRYVVVDTRVLALSGKARVVLADRLDPDAAVVGVERAGDCGSGTRCEQALLDAIARSAPQAAEYRALTSSFAACGHPVVALAQLPGGPGQGQVEPYVAAPVGPGPITGLLAELDVRVARWRAARADAPSPWAGTPVGLTLRVVDPSAVTGAPASDPALPPAVPSPNERLAALTRGPHHIAVLGPDDRVPVASQLYPVLPAEDATAFEAAVTASARAWLASADPAASVERYLSVATRVDPALPGRLRVYVLTSRRSDGSQDAVAITVDRDGSAAAEHRVVPDVRRPDGTFRLPVEP